MSEQKSDHMRTIELNEYEKTLRAALFVSIDSCPACGDEPQYCQGHGDIGDPEGAAILQEWEDYPDAWDWFAGWALDVEHYSEHTRDGLEPERTEILITFGGPNVRLIINHKHQSAHVHHTWDGDSHISWELAEEFADRFCPHPVALGLAV